MPHSGVMTLMWHPMYHHAQQKMIVRLHASVVYVSRLLIAGQREHLLWEVRDAPDSCQDRLDPGIGVCCDGASVRTSISCHDHLCTCAHCSAT